MNRIIIALLTTFICYMAQAACTDSQNKVSLQPEIKYTYENVFVGGDKKNIDTVSIDVPTIVDGLRLIKITISDGGILDTPRYKFPLAYSINSDKAHAEFEANLESIGDMNIGFKYESKECSKGFYKLIGR